MRGQHFGVFLTIGAAAVMGLSACSADSIDKTASTIAAENLSSEDSTPVTSYRRGELTGPDRLFLSELDDYWRAGEDADLIEIGEGVCQRLREGVSKTDVLKIFVGGEEGDDGSLTVETGNDFNRGVNLFSASVKAYCPEFLTGVR